jgi:hypothetical protein
MYADYVQNLSRGRWEALILSLANRFGPDPPFRVVMDCKAIVSLGPHLADTREMRDLLLNGLNFELKLDYYQCYNTSMQSSEL